MNRIHDVSWFKSEESPTCENRVLLASADTHHVDAAADKLITPIAPGVEPTTFLWRKNRNILETGFLEPICEFRFGVMMLILGSVPVESVANAIFSIGMNGKVYNLVPVLFYHRVRH